ncbi:MAG: patatin-like phospholipase family protein, partial [Myxococcota bacterium]
AGVLRFLYTELPKHLGRMPWPSVVAGTSVGALNGSFVVARDVQGLEWMCHTWRTITVPEVFGMSVGDLFRTLRALIAGEPFAFADPRPLQRMVGRNFPSRGVRHSVDALGVTWMVGATDLATGDQVVFVDRRDPPEWPAPPGVRYVHARVRARHALASGALPLLFPPITLGGASYIDGGLRQNTPLGPVLRAGARKVLVISLKSRAHDEVRQAQPANAVFLLGKLLNALLLDPVEVDLYDARRMNALIRWGTEQFGPAFAAGIEQQFGYREAEIVFHTPSVDLGALAADIYRASPPKVRGVQGQLLDLAANQTGPDADLLSYLYFDPAFTGEIEQLGFDDARRNQETLARLVGP